MGDEHETVAEAMEREHAELMDALRNLFDEMVRALRVDRLVEWLARRLS